MPSGSRITFREAAAADIPTPESGQVSLFVDSADSEPKYRDDGGTLHTLVGADGELTYLNHGNAGASEDIDVSAANIHRLVFDAATVTITFSSWPASGTPGIVRTYIVQDGTGGRLASWPGAVTWGAAGAPTLQTGANAIDIIDFQSVDGGTTVLGSYEVGSAATTAHIADTSDAHDASAISFDDTGLSITASDVQTAIEELDGAIGGGSLDADDLPWHIDIDPLHTAITNTNWDTLTVDVVDHLYGGHKVSSGAQNAEIGWDIVFGAGTWALEIIGQRDSNRGIYSIQFGGVEVGTIDGYNAGNIKNARQSATGIVIASTGKVRFTLKMANKNASSSSYFGDLNHIRWHRTA